jgi:leucyl aminopeptidase (aminopeptidase T)
LVGLPFPQYADMQWAAIGTDYQQLATAAKAFASKLHGAKKVHVTAAAGTDIVFAIGSRPVILNTGIVAPEAAKEKLILNRFVTLPGGSVTVAPQEATVTGVIVTPRDRCKFKLVRDARYEFASGTLAKATAKEGDACIQESLTAYGAGMHRLGGLTIGLNPALKAVEKGGDYRPANAAGMLTLTLGDNQLLNGANKVPGGVTIDLPVTHATVEIDGQVVVQDGNLVTGVAATTTR